MSVYRPFFRRIVLLTVSGLLAATLMSCGGEGGEQSNGESQSNVPEQAGPRADKVTPEQQESPASMAQSDDESAVQSGDQQQPIKPPLSNSYFVLDPKTNTVYELNRNSGEIIQKYSRDEPLVAVAHDTQDNMLYETVGGKNPALNIFDLSAREYEDKLEFPEPPSAMFFHPTQRRLYIVSEDSSFFRVYEPDSARFTFEIRMRIHNDRTIGPSTLEVGPLNKLVTANGQVASVTQILTEHNYMYQTVILHDAAEITSASFSFDGNSAFVTDTEQGAIYRVEFGSGKILAKKYGLVDPRLVQFEVNSRTVCVVENDIEVAFYNPDTFAETGRVDLSEYGDSIISLDVPPKANYAEILLDYKGVTRWLIVDIKNWEMLRFAELI